MAVSSSKKPGKKKGGKGKETVENANLKKQREQNLAANPFHTLAGIFEVDMLEGNDMEVVQPGEQVQLADAKHRSTHEAEVVGAEAGISPVKTLSKFQISTDVMLTNADNVEDIIESVNESPTSGDKDFNKSARELAQSSDLLLQQAQLQAQLFQENIRSIIGNGDRLESGSEECRSQEPIPQLQNEYHGTLPSLQPSTKWSDIDPDLEREDTQQTPATLAQILIEDEQKRETERERRGNGSADEQELKEVVHSWEPVAVLAEEVAMWKLQRPRAEDSIERAVVFRAKKGADLPVTIGDSQGRGATWRRLNGGRLRQPSFESPTLNDEEEDDVVQELPGGILPAMCDLEGISSGEFKEKEDPPNIPEPAPASKGITRPAECTDSTPDRGNANKKQVTSDPHKLQKQLLFSQEIGANWLAERWESQVAQQQGGILTPQEGGRRPNLHIVQPFLLLVGLGRMLQATRIWKVDAVSRGKGTARLAQVLEEN
ncbi:hypothetical protein R1sor_012060 [Riccia sorocarpa]|uniref:Uncharacterized protein n=1 Tax=Riccia sorocarpa TaxID=122646 RepID=A0ABD3I8U6_9MARC